MGSCCELNPGVSHNDEARTIWKGVVCVVLRTLWLEQNPRIFDEKSDDFENMGDKICYLASFCSVSPSFKGIPLILILGIGEPFLGCEDYCSYCLVLYLAPLICKLYLILINYLFCLLINFR